jgi:hybrid cluster-associated redox disulfide protein
MRITKEMTIEEVVTQYPETVPVLARYGVGCTACSASQYDDLETGARVHGIALDRLLEELNAAVHASP